MEMPSLLQLCTPRFVDIQGRLPFSEEKQRRGRGGSEEEFGGEERGETMVEIHYPGVLGGSTPWALYISLYLL